MNIEAVLADVRKLRDIARDESKRLSSIPDSSPIEVARWASLTITLTDALRTSSCQHEPGKFRSVTLMGSPDDDHDPNFERSRCIKCGEPIVRNLDGGEWTT